MQLMRYQGPEQRSREGASVNGRVQHGAGTHSVLTPRVHPFDEVEARVRAVGCSVSELASSNPEPRREGEMCRPARSGLAMFGGAHSWAWERYDNALE
jgi:hypothetical protein